MPESTNKNRSRTLKYILLRFVGALLLVLLLGNFFLNISITRDYLQEQLQSHAQDAATALGLSLSSVIDARDLVLAGRMIDAIFDSGDYRTIVLRDVQGKTLINREQVLRIETVPNWFVSLIELVTPSREAQVMSGWNQLGTLVVESHPGYAYLELWRVMQTQLIWFGLVAMLGLILAQVFISAILQPLMRIERQAHEISNNRFDYRAPMPNTRELARVALAMNEMADKLGHVFSEQLNLIEDLREQSFQDELTGLSNRAGFDRRLKADLESKQSVVQGTLILIQLSQFDAVNQQHGREVGDNILQAVAEVLIQLTRRHVGSYGARRSGADFSVFLPGMTGDEADEAASKLMAKLSALHPLKHLLRDDVLHIGVACAKADDSSGTLLSKSDMALRQAQGKGVSGWQRYAHIVALNDEAESDETSNLDSAHVDANSALAEVRQASEWLAILQEVLARRRVQLYVQPVFGMTTGDMTNEAPLYQQVLARIDVEGDLVVAGLFLPMVERFKLMVPFDQMVVEKVIESLMKDQNTGQYCVTLSESALVDEHFLVWLTAQLASAPSVAKRLIFEVPEYVVNYSEDALLKLCNLSTQQGFKVFIERFGASSVPFSYLQRIAIDGIKVDHSFIRDIDDSQDNQFFLRSAIQIAHSQGIQIVGVGVESEREWDTLRTLGIDGALGYYLGRPKADTVFSSSGQTQ